MQRRNFRTPLRSTIVVLVLALALALVGCNGDDNGGGLTALDLAGRSFTYPASFLRPGVTGTATQTFGAANTVMNNTIPFTITFQNEPGTVLIGTATINSIDSEITAITVDGDPVEQVIIDGQAFSVGDTFTFDTTVVRNSDGSVVITLTNTAGTVFTFTFADGQTGATGSTGG